ncbi:MAG TPA: phosphatase PAP2 family protein [Rhizomicrobium sp.]|jgi:membrane-associated phospholipid phosphatase|nr:phosphatase PAP2 family protein [Rhizomicrobium sp.]
MRIPAALALVALLCAPQAAQAAGTKALTTSGTMVAIALPVVAGGISIYKDDWNGAAQLGLNTVLTVGTAFALKQVIRERRPDGSDWKSFPSDTTALAASGSSYLWKRYGWEYGLPAFAASQFVSFTRVEAKKHHWYDTLASSVIAIGYSQLVVSRYRKPNFYSSLEASPDGAMLRLAYDF